ncbi:ABC transporter ATP-binding protein [Arachnia propionica]|uniref:ABC transporter ATP-binding protein n=1 Tax=Arachnia propionica TaxID=1750 RepID=A0A3P1TDS0_9ACTN|nr:ABC transporter ATP-binding protein [Arachnia propionica]RRD07046.1 ABC transporter ATP-binding protein [Arachnia propionica]
MTHLVEFRRVDVTFHRNRSTFRALHEVDLTVAAGERVGIVGGSGSGKTTLLRTILGLVQPSAGEVIFDGERVDHRTDRQLAEMRRRVSLIHQDPNSSLNPRMRLRDIIAEPLRSPWTRRSGIPVNQLVAEVVEAVGLDVEVLEHYPHQLSGGQRQRIAIARALISEPDLLIADEPVSALDVSVRAQVLNLLGDTVRERGLAMLFVSHDLAVVRHLCQQVVVLRHGRVVETGPVPQVLDDPEDPYTRELVKATLSL